MDKSQNRNSKILSSKKIKTFERTSKSFIEDDFDQKKEKT